METQVGSDVAEALAALRGVVSAIECGELSAGPEQLAWLHGSMHALELVLDGQD